MPEKQKWDGYLLPNGTFKNLLGITDAEELSSLEYMMVAERQVYLELNDFVLPSGTKIKGRDFSEVIELHAIFLMGYILGRENFVLLIWRSTILF